MRKDLLGAVMTMKLDYPSQLVTANDEIYYADGNVRGSVCPEITSYGERSTDMSATRKVWYDYLAQHGVRAAILSVLLPSAGSQRHAFLVGLESARHDLHATQQLLTIAEQLWARMDRDPSLQFDVSTIWAGHPETGLVGDLLTHFDHGVLVQTQHQGATVRAVYFREKGLDRFTRQEVASVQLILPLFAESAAGGAQLARQSQRSAMLEAMFDRVSLSMTMLSADAQPLFMNSAAKAMLDERKWLIRSADGSISSMSSRQSKQLRESIRLAATADPCAMTENVFRLDCSNGEWRLAYIVSAFSRSGETTNRCALLIVLAPGKIDAPTQMLEALGLLPSEQRFLGHFLKSSSLGSAAVDCGLSEETARTYLKRVRAKLGVHRQMELAGLISGLVLPIHAGNTQSVGE
jgi:hypothetical protein